MQHGGCREKSHWLILLLSWHIYILFGLRNKPHHYQHKKALRSRVLYSYTKDSWRLSGHVGMSRSATLATRNDARRRLKPPKVTSLATVPIGTAIWSCCERLPRRWRMVADTKAASSEHCSTPQNPKVNENPSLCIRGKIRLGLLSPGLFFGVRDLRMDKLPPDGLDLSL